MQSSQERQQFRHVSIPPGLPLFSDGSGKRLGQRTKHLVHMRRDHLLFDLFPMLEPLHLAPYASQFIGPSKKSAGSMP